MGKTSVMALMAFLVISGNRLTQRTTTQQATETRDAQTRYELMARNAATYGYERAKQYVAGNAGATTQTGTYQGIGYSTSITYAGGYATVRAVGTLSDAGGVPVTYRVNARLQRVVSLPSAAPQFLQFALMTDLDLTVNGNVLVDTFRVEGDTRAPANANLHTNHTLRVNGASALVRGFGTYSESQNVGQSDRVFKPYSNPTNAPVVSKASAVVLPDFTAAALADSLGASLRTGGVSLSGTVDFTSLGATRDHPYVWYVGGNLLLDDNTRLKGYVVFLVSGDVTVKGNRQVALGDGYGESNAAWYLNGTLTLKGNSEIWGQFYTRGDVVLSGTPRVYGSITSRQGASISGTPKIYYVPASPALTTAWQMSEVRLFRVAYSEGW